MTLGFYKIALVGLLLLSACRVASPRDSSSSKANANDVLAKQQQANQIYLNSATILGLLSARSGVVVKNISYGQLRLEEPHTVPVSVYLARTMVQEKPVYYFFEENGRFLPPFGSDNVTVDNPAVLTFKLGNKTFQFWGNESYLAPVKKSAEAMTMRAKKLAAVMQSFANQKEIIQTNILNYFHNKQTNETLLAHAQKIASRYRGIQIEGESLVYLSDPFEVSKRVLSVAEKLQIVTEDDRVLMALIDENVGAETDNALNAAAKTKIWFVGALTAVGFVAAAPTVGASVAGGINAIHTGLSNLAATIAGGSMAGFGGGAFALAEGGVVAGGSSATLSTATLAALSEKITIAIGLSFAMGIPAIGGASSYYGSQNPQGAAASKGTPPKFVKESLEKVSEFAEEVAKAPTGPASIKLSDALAKMTVLFKP